MTKDKKKLMLICSHDTLGPIKGKHLGNRRQLKLINDNRGSKTKYKR